MADKLIGADALTRAIVNSPSDISGYNPVYCNGVAKRQLEILDIILNINGTTYGEIRAKAIDEFAEKLYNKSTDLRDIESDDYGILHYEDVYEVAEELKGVQEC